MVFVRQAKLILVPLTHFWARIDKRLRLSLPYLKNKINKIVGNPILKNFVFVAKSFVTRKLVPENCIPEKFVTKISS